MPGTVTSSVCMFFHFHSFYSQQLYKGSIIVIIPIYEWGNWGTEMLDKFSG